ncbi:MAG: hypothetical protein ACLT76_01545 [Clostridium fessum]
MIFASGSCGRQFQNPWKMLTMPVRTLAFVGSREQVKEMNGNFDPEIADVCERTWRGCGRERQFQGRTDSQAGGVFGKRRSLSDTKWHFGDSAGSILGISAAGKPGIGVAMGNAVDAA